MRQIRIGDPQDIAIENLRAMVTAQSALIFGMLAVMGETRFTPSGHMRAVLEAALEMVDDVGGSMPGQVPDGLRAARGWLERLLDDLPPRPHCSA